jgi:hypothetical protein
MRISGRTCTCSAASCRGEGAEGTEGTEQSVTRSHGAARRSRRTRERSRARCCCETCEHRARLRSLVLLRGLRAFSVTPCDALLPSPPRPQRLIHS